MASFLLWSQKTCTKNVDLRSLHYSAKAGVVVVGVKTRIGALHLLSTANNSSGTPVTRPWRFDGVFTVIAARLRWENPFSIAENRSILAVWMRPTSPNGTFRRLRFLGQFRQADLRHRWRPLGPSRLI
jgi:hypothetical protein